MTSKNDWIADWWHKGKIYVIKTDGTLWVSDDNINWKRIQVRELREVQRKQSYLLITWGVLVLAALIWCLFLLFADGLPPQ